MIKCSWRSCFVLFALGTFAIRPAAAQTCPLIKNPNPCSDLKQPANVCVQCWKCNAADHAWWPEELAPAGTKCTTVLGQMGTCPGGKAFEDNIPTCAPLTYSISVTVSGLVSGTALELLDNGGSQLSITHDGYYTFATRLSSSAPYKVTVESPQPSGQTCLPSNWFGRVQGANVTNVAVKCTTPADITACDSNGCISEAKICANVSESLENPPPAAGVSPPPVVGYVCIAGGLPPVYGGLARTASNPPMTQMSPDLVTNIASVSKTMTTVGVLKSLARHGLMIDSKISAFIYSDWVQGPNIEKITFKELLTHTAGVRANCNSSYSDLKALIANGVNVSDIGVPSYNNCNFAIFRELLPVMEGYQFVFFPPPFGPPIDVQRAAQSASFYISYMNQNVFQPVGVPVSACKPPAGTNDMLSYPYPAGTTSGTDWGDWTLSCGGGGWVLSAQQIFSVIDDLADGNVLLTNAQKNQMFTDCLGWDCAVRPDCPNPYVCKNGSLNNGNGIAVWTYAGIFKCTVPVVVVVNSPLPGGQDTIDVVQNAYNLAAVPGTPKPCP